MTILPIRHETHQLEDASRRAFERLLPDAWVSRPKIPDYGVDLEVEIFDDDGSSTGLLFFVQLRATNDVKRERKMTFEVDQLQYLNSLDVPTLLVRYGGKGGTFFSTWHFLIKPSPKELSQKTITISFGDSNEWTSESPRKIRQLLARFRSVRSGALKPPVPLRVVKESGTANNRFQLERAAEEVAALSASLVMVHHPPDDPDEFEIEVRIREDAIVVAVDELCSFTMETDTDEDGSYVSALLYGIVSLCEQLSLAPLAENLALAILRRRAVSHSRYLALMAVRALKSRPNDMVSLAILNELQDASQFEYAVVTHALIERSKHDPDDQNWLAKWFDVAMNMAVSRRNTEVQGSIHQNRGNAAQLASKFADAIFHYNRARKLCREFLEADWFLRELAGLLFFCRRFRLSKKFYLKAVTLGENASLSLRLGDSQLFAGKVVDAQRSFSDASDLAGTSPLGFEAGLKLDLCEWLEKQFGDQLPRMTSLADAAISVAEAETSSDFSTFERITLELDALHPLANFNAGIGWAKEGNHKEALPRFLIASFSVPSDTDAWSNAMICAWNLEGENLFVVMSAALEATGLRAHSVFRSKLHEQGMPDEGLEMLDAVVRELRRPGRPSEEFHSFARDRIRRGDRN